MGDDRRVFNVPGERSSSNALLRRTVPSPGSVLKTAGRLAESMRRVLAVSAASPAKRRISRESGAGAGLSMAAVNCLANVKDFLR